MLALWVASWFSLGCALAVTTSLESGLISARKVGGLYFLKAGRYGASFYASKK